jgi:plasmid segregation protein ParM
MDGDEATVAPEGLTGVIDIGFRTTDLAAIEDGEYIPEKSKTLSVGMATASSDIASSLATEYGLEKESYALDGAIIRGRINLAGRTIDISDIVARALERLAANVLVEIHSHWRSTDFDNFMLTGGGGQAVSAFLLPQLSQAKLVTDPVTANCRGYLAWGNRLWKLPGLQGVQKETVAGNGQGNDRQFS